MTNIKKNNIIYLCLGFILLSLTGCSFINSHNSKPDTYYIDLLKKEILESFEYSTGKASNFNCHVESADNNEKLVTCTYTIDVTLVDINKCSSGNVIRQSCKITREATKSKKYAAE